MALNKFQVSVFDTSDTLNSAELLQICVATLSCLFQQMNSMISEKSFSSASSRNLVTRCLPPATDPVYIYELRGFVPQVAGLSKNTSNMKNLTYGIYVGQVKQLDIVITSVTADMIFPYEELYSSFQKGSGTLYAFDSLVLETNLLHSPKAVVGTYIGDEFVKYFLALNIVKVSGGKHRRAPAVEGSIRGGIIRGCSLIRT